MITKATDTDLSGSGTAKAGGGWLAAALAVASGQSGAEAAALAGVSLRTVRRWQRKPAFKQLVERVREQLVSDTLGRLLASNTAAVDALAGLLASKQEHVRLGAASRLLGLTLKTRHQERLAAELERIKDLWAKFQADHPQMFGAKDNEHEDGQQ